MKILIVILFFSTSNIYSQGGTDPKLDSLMNKFSSQKGIEKAETSKKIGTYYKKNSQYYSAIEYCQIARDLYEENTNLSGSEKAKNVALCDLSIGVEYFFIGDHKKAMEYYIKAYRVIPENIDLLLNIQGVFSSQDNYQKAFYYAEKAMTVAHKTKNSSELDRIWSIKSDIYFSKKDSLNGFKALEKSIEFSKNENDYEQLAITYTNYGDLLPDSKQKIDLYLKSKALWDKYQPNNLLAISNGISIANFYRKMEDKPDLLKQNNISRNEAIEKAETMLLLQIENCKKINHKGKNLQYAMECLSYVYELKYDYKNAHKYFQDCVMIYDSLNSIDSKNKILNVEASFNISQKDKEIQFSQKLIQQEKTQKWLYIFGLGLVTIIGGLLFYQSRNRKKTNEKLQLLNTELDQANKTKTRFFSILNHDLRSPVANLIHFLHLQKDSPELLDEETKNRMQAKTISGAEDLLSSMEDILLWSKGQMENFKPQPKNVNVNQLFDDTKKVFSGYHKISFEYQNPDNIELFTDENYLKTIVRNLTSNAINIFTTTANPKITWKAWKENSVSYLSITDNGVGASKEQFKALYDDKEVVGIKSGLGLHLIRDLAKAINCQVEVVSEQEIGTTFTLKF
jgi:signal transduction histidine kinase